MTIFNKMDISKKRRYFVGWVLMATFLWGIVSFFIMPFFSSTELIQKPMWALVEAWFVVNNKNLMIPGPLYVSNASGSKFDLLGLPEHKNEPPRIWIVLNPVRISVSEKKVIKMPEDVMGEVSCQYVQVILNQETIYPEYFKLNANQFLVRLNNYKSWVYT